jgi:hypothetical protein
MRNGLFKGKSLNIHSGHRRVQKLRPTGTASTAAMGYGFNSSADASEIFARAGKMCALSHSPASFAIRKAGQFSSGDKNMERKLQNSCWKQRETGN